MFAKSLWSPKNLSTLWQTNIVVKYQIIKTQPIMQRSHILFVPGLLVTQASLTAKSARLLAYALFMVLALSISACGFQPTSSLRANSDSQWTPIYLKPRSALDYKIQRALQAEGVYTRSQTGAKSTLTLSDIKMEQRDLTITSDGRNAELVLILSASAEWLTSQKDLAPLLNASFSFESSFAANPSNPSAASAEARRIQEQLESRLVNEVLRRMSLLMQQEKQTLHAKESEHNS